MFEFGLCWITDQYLMPFRSVWPYMRWWYLLFFTWYVLVFALSGMALFFNFMSVRGAALLLIMFMKMYPAIFWKVYAVLTVNTPCSLREK